MKWAGWRRNPPFSTSRKSTVIALPWNVDHVSEVQRGISLKKLVVELIFLLVGDMSLKQPREFYGRLFDADFYVTPTAEDREQK